MATPRYARPPEEFALEHDQDLEATMPGSMPSRSRSPFAALQANLFRASRSSLPLRSSSSDMPCFPGIAAATSPAPITANPVSPKLRTQASATCAIA